MERNDENHVLSIEALQNYFLWNQGSLKDFVEILRKVLKDKKNPYREKIARRHIYIFSQLCDFFWLYDIKSELDDFAFSIDKPEDYITLKKNLERYEKKSAKVISKISKKLKEHLLLYNPIIEIEWRFKSLFSIYRKCQKKNTDDIGRLGDIFAFRIIVEGKSDICYDILTLLHNDFSPNPEQFKDYITIPKINGYQALHTWLSWIISDFDRSIEIQIKTKTMHYFSIHGSASHAIYSNNKHSYLLEKKEQKLLQYFQENLQKEYIYPMCYKGRIFKWIQGMDAQDFAKKIHSKLAENMTWVLVNNEVKSFDTILNDFDIVEILT